LIKSIKINSLDTQTRIDRWLKRKFSNLSQSFIEKNIRKGFIKINKKKIKSNYKVIKNDIVEIYNFSIEKYSLKIKKKMNKKISKNLIDQFKKSTIYENNDFMIIDKWSGLASQAGSKVNVSIDDIIKNISPYYNLVHRLDKDTSGLMIIGKNLITTKNFSKLFNEKKIEKIYLAICQGTPKTLDSLIKLKIPIQKDKKIFKDAITKFNLIKKNQNFCFLAFKPLTGKKHQLRILSKKISCPIVGDTKYNLDKKFSSENLKLNAYFLKFRINNQEYKFKSNLPQDFKNFLYNEKFNFNKNEEFLKFF